jgi:hypothetical protein
MFYWLICSALIVSVNSEEQTLSKIENAGQLLYFAKQPDSTSSVIGIL